MRTDGVNHAVEGRTRTPRKSKCIVALQTSHMIIIIWLLFFVFFVNDGDLNKNQISPAFISHVSQTKCSYSLKNAESTT